MGQRICSIEGCDRPVFGYGWCNTHYQRWRRHRDPMRGFPTVSERFWNKVDKTPGHGPWGDCWIWTAGNFSNGYGQFTLDGVNRGAHRVAWELEHGPIPDGHLVRHACDIKLCVRHLLLGDPSDNAQDMVDRKRQARGERQHLARLNIEAVRFIRQEYGPRSCGSLAAELGVNASTVERVVRGETWKDVI